MITVLREILKCGGAPPRDTNPNIQYYFRLRSNPMKH